MKTSFIVIISVLTLNYAQAQLVKSIDIEWAEPIKSEFYEIKLPKTIKVQTAQNQIIIFEKEGEHINSWKFNYQGKKGIIRTITPDYKSWKFTSSGREITAYSTMPQFDDWAGLIGWKIITQKDSSLLQGSDMDCLGTFNLLSKWIPINEENMFGVSAEYPKEIISMQFTANGNDCVSSKWSVTDNAKLNDFEAKLLICFVSVIALPVRELIRFESY